MTAETIPVDRDTLLLYAKAASDSYLRGSLVRAIGVGPLVERVGSLDDRELLTLLAELDGNAWSWLLGSAYATKADEPA